MASTPAIHHSATAGFSNATAYDAHRPSYPSEAVEKFLAHLGLAGPGRSGARILDLAAGTGKMTELLAARPEGFELLAIEPHDRMRETLGAKGLPNVASQSGTAEDMAVADGWADAVVAAQAFHWFAKLDALQEIHRVLKSGGHLAVIWNVENYNQPRSWKAETAWEKRLNELVINASTDGQPRFRDDVWRQVFDRQQGLFSTPIGEDKTEWTIWLSPEALWDRLSTMSHVAMMNSETRGAFKAKFDSIVDEGDTTRNEMGELAVHGTTTFAWTMRL